VNFAFNEEQLWLRDSARKFLAENSPPAQVHALAATDRGYDPEVWARVAGELGWPALIVPEDYGGFGFSYLELVAVMEEMGRALACAPLLSGAAAAGAILAAGDEDQKAALLPDIAAGEQLATLAWVGTPDPARVSVTARADGDAVALDGVLTALDGHAAGLLLVPARAGDDVALYAVPADTPGVMVERLHTMDQTRRLARVRLEGARLPASARLGAGGWGPISEALDLAAVLLAAENVGVADFCLAQAVEYAKVREQFGRAIGSFQAIKHKCADMLLLVESARSAAWYAGWLAAQSDMRGELPLAAADAASYCAEAAFSCAAESIQIHGGIGFTWEHDAHLYFKRARANRALLGAPAWWRERVAAAALGE